MPIFVAFQRQPHIYGLDTLRNNMLRKTSHMNGATKKC
jgi:hypothetical protein